MLYEECTVKKKIYIYYNNKHSFSFSPLSLPLSPAIFKTRYQIVVEIVQATTISNFPQVKRQKGKNPVCYQSYLFHFAKLFEL